MMSALGLESYTSASMFFLAGSAFVAGLARGFSGFGSALIFIPLASSIIGAKLASPLLLVIDFVAAAPLIPNGWRQADRRDVSTMLLGSLIGVPIGTWALTQMDGLAVRWMIVALVVPMLALLMSGWRYRGTPTALLTAAVGAIAGFFNGVAQVGGPPIVLYWLRDTTAARIVRANIIVYFAASSVLTTISYLVGGVLTTAVIGAGRSHRPRLRHRAVAGLAHVRVSQRGNLPPHLLRTDRAGGAGESAGVRWSVAVSIHRRPREGGDPYAQDFQSE